LQPDHERFLHQLIGVVIVAHQPAGHPLQEASMAGHVVCGRKRL
jgi:hypothetical protein